MTRAGTTMRRLKQHQTVILAVEDTLVECRVAAIAQAAAVLVPVRFRQGDELPEHTSRAELVFHHGPGLVMLKGMLRRGATPDDLRFTVGDGVQMTARRRDSRLQVELPVRLRRPDGGELELVTADVSSTGIGVVGDRVAGEGDTVRVELTLPDGGVVSATARVVRCTSTVTALRFDAFAADGRARLGEFVLARQREQAVAAS